MAENEGRVHTNRRNIHSNRGGQSRLYNQLGVKDLRELLDRKRSEREAEVSEPNAPPPEPACNNPKESLKDNDENTSEHLSRTHNARKFHHKNNASSNLKQNKGQYFGNQPSHSKSKDIENPLNIKVEFSTATGEHVYKIDETTVLPTIKHVPDRFPIQNRSFRGRGRGRGRGHQRTYHTRTIHSKSQDSKTPTNKSFEEKQAPIESISVSCNVEESWDEEVNENPVVESKTEEIDDGCVEQYVEDELVQEDHLQTAVQNISLEENKVQNDSVTEEKKQ